MRGSGSRWLIFEIPAAPWMDMDAEAEKRGNSVY